MPARYIHRRLPLTATLLRYTRQFNVTTAAEVLGITVVDLTIAIGEPDRAMSVGYTSERSRFTYRYLGQREPTISADGKVLAFIRRNLRCGRAQWGIGR